ncbi:DUF3251 domain-containing protein [Brenneria uluponensis]|uniref:DUF3251 domain-containing protein n=1 Tax=Brenneria uluponensis TaxID=3057057 RepID=UPI0028F09938|nr:DUF3251 domain-containing protein [Brenneria ulupoensis]
MTIRYRLIFTLSAMALLAGCAQPQTTHVQNEIGQLNQKLRDLSDRAAALEQQNSLNANSTSGAYLLPAAKDSALIDSSIGRLSLSLSQIEPEANGTRALLVFRTLNDTALPAFSVQINWGPLDPVSGKPLDIDMQTLSLTVPQPLIPKPEVTVDVRLSDLSPEQLGFVRVHHIIAEPSTHGVNESTGTSGRN